MSDETMGDLGMIELVESLNRECSGMSERLATPDPDPDIQARLLKGYLGSIWTRVHMLRHHLGTDR